MIGAARSARSSQNRVLSRPLMVCAPLVSATLVGCLLRPGGKSSDTPSDANGTSDAKPDAGPKSDAIPAPDATEPTDATPPDGATMFDGGVSTTSCDPGYMPLACSCTNATTNGDGSRTLSDGGSCTCSTSTLVEGYVHLDGGSGSGSG